MPETVITTIFTIRYGEIDIKVVAEHTDDAVGFKDAAIYSFWNSDEESLGWFVRAEDEFYYYGDDLTEEEQQQLAAFIRGYREDEWDL
jgi:hypothetical protein